MPSSSVLPRKPVDILLVEDNPGDIRLMREALKGGYFVKQLAVVKDGEQALAFLRREDPYADVAVPSLILLDLNLPRKNGREVLAEIKSEKSLRHIPVFVVSTSTREEDIAAAYDLHANCYIPKPLDLEGLIEMGRLIEAFWLRMVALPSAGVPSARPPMRINSRIRPLISRKIS